MQYNKRYILLDINNDCTAGTKARNDVCDILVSEGYEKIILFNRDESSLKRLLQTIRSLLRLSRRLERNDFIVVQYPYRPQIMKLILGLTAKKRKKVGAGLVILIHDVLYLRGDGAQLDEDAELLKQKEIALLNRADYIISHNEFMANQLYADGLKTPQVLLGIFDYLFDKEAPASKKGAGITTSDVVSIAYAGNFDVPKGEFIYKVGGLKNYRFIGYGYASHPENMPENVLYKGLFPPEELLGAIEGDYGLIWDGPTVESCDGRHGNYLRFNNPHKVSLFVAAGLPVLVWKDAAIAHFVVNHGIGVAIESLTNLRIPAPGSEEYEKMRQNTLLLREQLGAGNRLKNAIEKIMSQKHDKL